MILILFKRQKYTYPTKFAEFRHYFCSCFSSVTDEDQTPASGLIVPIVLGVAGFLMLLIIIVIATVYCCGAKRRRRRRDPSQSTDDTTSDTDEGQGDSTGFGLAFHSRVYHRWDSLLRLFHPTGENGS